MKATTFAPVILASTAAAAVVAEIASFSLACNPAHSYPDGVSCIETGGTLSLVGPTATTSCNLLDVGSSCYATAGPTTASSPSTKAQPTTTSAQSVAPSYPSSTTAATSNLTVVSSPAPASSSSSTPACMPGYSYLSGTCTSTAISSTPLTTITQATTHRSHSKASHSKASHHTTTPSLRVDTTSPPVQSASGATTSAPASTSPSPASGDAPAIAFGGVTALVVFVGLLVL